MGKRVGMEVAIASAEAAALCKFDVAAVYPITPQSHVAEHLSDIVNDGRVDASFMTVESEHSALSAAVGSSATGARVVTATSSQGLLFMSEVMPIASAMRLPIVMLIANRAVSGPSTSGTTTATSCRCGIRVGSPSSRDRKSVV